MAFSPGKGRNERGTVHTSTFIQQARIHKQQSCNIQANRKQYNRLQARIYVQHSHLHRFYLQTAPHRATKSKDMATLTDKGGRQGPWTDVAWNLVDRPGPRDRRVLPAPSWRDGGQVATSTPHGLAWPRLTSGPWRGQRALSGSAAPPVCASSDRPLAGPRAQDQDDDDSHDPPPTTTELDFTITSRPTTNQRRTPNQPTTMNDQPT